MDADRTGKITYTEWLAATIEESMLQEDRTIEEAFDFFDLDATGTINLDELTRVLGEEEALLALKAI